MPAKSGKLSLSVNEMQGCLKQVLEADHPLTAEQRYAIMGAMETMEFLKRLAPGLKKSLEDFRKTRKTI